MGASTRSGGRTEAGPGATTSSPASSDAPSIEVRGHAGPKTGDVVGEPFGKPSPNRVGQPNSTASGPLACSVRARAMLSGLNTRTPSTCPPLARAPYRRASARAVVWAHAKEIHEHPTTEEGCVLNLNDPETLERVLRSME